jgi:hypothetical protein
MNGLHTDHETDNVYFAWLLNNLMSACFSEQNSSDICFVFRSYHVRISVDAENILVKIFLDFPQFFQTNFWTVSSINHSRFLTHRFWSILYNYFPISFGATYRLLMLKHIQLSHESTESSCIESSLFCQLPSLSQSLRTFVLFFDADSKMGT